MSELVARARRLRRLVHRASASETRKLACEFGNFARALRSLAVVGAAAAGCAYAAGTCADFLHALAERESSMDAAAMNQYGYVGLFQMGEMALIDAGYYRPDGTGTNDWRGGWTGRDGISSLADFRNSPEAQVAAVTAYHARVMTTLVSRGVTSAIGQTIAGVPITASGLLAAAHLVGPGAVQRFVESGGAYDAQDGNHTRMSEYLARFGGYQLIGAGNNCAAMATGVATGGVAIVPPAGGGGAVPTYTGGALASGGMTSDEAYYAGAGYTTSEMATLVKLTTASILMALAGWASFGSWTLYEAGRSSWGSLLHHHRRLMVIVAAVLVILS